LDAERLISVLGTDVAASDGRRSGCEIWDSNMKSFCIGEAMKKVIAQVDRVAATEPRVCILGETGTGKDLVSRTLHEKGPRASGPFVH